MAKILDVKIDHIKFSEAMAKIAAFLEVDELHQIATVNPEFVMAAQRDEEFKKIINQTDLNVPDGVGIKFAAWFLGQKIGDRLTGVDLVWEISKIAAERTKSIFFYGAADGVAAMTAHRIQALYPNLKIAGTYLGTSGEEDEQIVERINEANPDVLFVATGSPKQEKFIFNNKYRLKVKLAMGCGGAFDYIADVVPYPSKWIRAIGMEWLYRLLTQKNRARRIFTAVFRFPWAVFISRFKK